ncbi:transposase [Actinomyces naeslundii]|uniref:transposase n=1 Tax=Actinomyces naeslundii TaxID=1655 RepID=UPI0015C0A8B2
MIYLDAIRVKVRARPPGRLPLGPHRGRGRAWTGPRHVLGIWVQGEEGASLKGGSCAPVPAQQRRERRADRRGGTSRTGAKRAGAVRRARRACPRGEQRRSWPQATVQTCAGTTRFRAPGCGSCPTGTARRSPPLSRPTCTAPNEEAAWQALTDFSASDLGVKYPETAATWERAWERFTPFLAFPPMLRRVISPPLRGRYPLDQQHRDCELPAEQGHQEPRPLPQ